ncbi:PepSY-associated TM helix domain-containing protein [Fuscibacter oryzae]|uniref:PepSY domain-containing protein n=1 Tax=Fuscibacter oryzae TaxID=2803939 RepID=A0A8J7SSE8_9RHOB|nr:PepSY domain-containing protein [Fuscibacter oryzae]MBL4926687.1 PepSY domain-containing protein [Fuscibacter oryzae]
MASVETNGPARAQKLYFAVWRWHFYAGLYVIPFLLMLSLTGALIIWFTAVAPEYGDRLPVAVNGVALTVTQQIDAALTNHPDGAATAYITPIDATTPALVQITATTGARMVAVDPYTGTVLSDRPKAGTWNEWLTDLHGTLFLGPDGGLGDFLIEAAASLGLLLIVTGIYLVWPRNGGKLSAVFIPNLAAKGRAFWKSLHQSLGSWIAIFLVFFLISGLAWAGIWGGKFVQAWSSFPAEKWGAPLSDKTHASLNDTALKEVPWVLELAPLPESGSQTGVQLLPEGTPVTFETAVAGARALGFTARVQVAAPADDTGVWTLSRDSMSYDSPNPTADRTVHIDRYSGKILADVRFADYPLGGKAMAVGIALHEGQLGWWNVALNWAFCASIWGVSLSGLVMWWKRRPDGALRLAAPPVPADVPLAKGVVLITLALSLAFPVLGLTLLAILVLDVVLLSPIPFLKRALS